jgi:phenylalanine-4-hydroxylase
MWERFFWFTLEFALCETPEGLRIFGAGIASSFGECAYALDERRGPERVHYSVDDVIHQEYRIDEMQKKLYVLRSPEELYESLPKVKKQIENSR